jgi:type I restriction enzyme R subunit
MANEAIEGKGSLMDTFRFNELMLSQLPALRLLVNLGYTYLSPQDALKERGDRQGNVLLEGILREQLRKLNRIEVRGQSYLFSEENLQTAIQRLKSVKYDGLVRTNEQITDLLVLGSSLEQSIDGDTRSHTLNFIDWRHPDQNVYHVVPEFAVERTRSYETCRPDLVLFVNGIPLGVIECKSPDVELTEGVSQTIRNQTDDHIPRLFTYAQLVLATNKNEVKYATVGTPAKFWAVWKEEVTDAEVLAIRDMPLSESVRAGLFDFLHDELRSVAEGSADLEPAHSLTTEDRGLYSLCRPERLLELSFIYSVFDAGVRKVARYQQYFAVKRVMHRIKQREADGRRSGGMVWHTQGSGKSLTMVMLAKVLAIDPEISNPRIILVTDRVDLDKQLGATFAACGLQPERAESGRDLLRLVGENKAHIVTSLIHKFDKALSARNFRDDSPDIFVLVDESHRTQFGGFAARMRQMFPRACYLGFTGTPLMKKEKNNFQRFGGLIDAYTINQAVKDEAVVPLLYEPRHVEVEQNKKAIDTWFERHTAGLTSEQKRDLKTKFARAEMLNKTDQVIYMRAFDISEHYRMHWQGTGFKAQLVAPDKCSALRYKEYLDELGHVSSEVVISAPDSREGYEDTDAPPADEVVEFWTRMMKRHGNEDEYIKAVIGAFKGSDDPEILIVVDKLLTGFDAPRNTVLYLARSLREHTLLQAIARVNRLYDEDGGKQSKDYGYIIDYHGVLGELDNALTSYSALAEFDESELVGAVTSLHEEAKKLPQRHSEVWDIFKTIRDKTDEEAFEQLLGDLPARDRFYESLTAFGKALAIALSSEQYMTTADPARIATYKDDLKRFTRLRSAVKLRYAESVDYRDYEPRIRKLLDTHITATEVTRLHEPVNIFDEQTFKQAVEEQTKGHSKAAVADMIAHTTKRAISERMEQDPAFYSRFSQLIQEAIDDYRARRISELEYLNKARDIRETVANGRREDMPASLRGSPDEGALFGVIAPLLRGSGNDTTTSKAAEQAAVTIWEIIRSNRKVDYWNDLDAIRQTKNGIDDFLYDVIKGGMGLALTADQMDEIIERAMDLARHRDPSA